MKLGWLDYHDRLRNASAEATNESEHYLSSMLMGATLGGKLVSDAKAVIEDRSVDSEMSTQLEQAFAKLPTSVAMVDGQRLSSQQLVCLNKQFCLLCQWIVEYDF